MIKYVSVLPCVSCLVHTHIVISKATWTIMFELIVDWLNFVF